MHYFKNNFILNQSNALAWFTIPAFEAGGLVTHGFTTRHGGVSVNNYAALNLGLHVGDKPAAVLENRRRVYGALNIASDWVVTGEQIHGSKVALVTAKSGHNILPGVDALVTNVPGIPLTSYYADCVPLFFFDPENVVVGLAHAGWRGTAQFIGLKTVQTMSRAFGSSPENILVGIGPSIGSCCYVVGEKVSNIFVDKFTYWQELIQPCGGQKWLLNLWETNRRMLVDAGIKATNITVSNLCTACHGDLFFSYRVSGGITGRMASLIMIH